MEKLKRKNDFDLADEYERLYRRWRAITGVLLVLLIITCGFASRVFGLYVVKFYEDIPHCCYGG